jgi:hypothetical protein
VNGPRELSPNLGLLVAIIGAACMVAGGFLVSPAAGLLILGGALIALAVLAIE